jgi:hypothetical protein
MNDIMELGNYRRNKIKEFVDMNHIQNNNQRPHVNNEVSQMIEGLNINNINLQADKNLVDNAKNILGGIKRDQEEAMGGVRRVKSRKSRKQRKSRKSRKSRKQRKSRKSRKSRKQRK